MWYFLPIVAGCCYTGSSNARLVREVGRLISEVRQQFLQHQDAYERGFPLIADAFENEYEWPEMDTLRHEACLCIAFGLNQAAITLCNHLLESLLKYSLIYHHSINRETKTAPTSTEVVKLMESYTEEGISKYAHLTLNRTIDEAHSLSLIDDEEKDTLHKFRHSFRNAYSHADKKKTFGDTAVPVQGARIEGGRIITGVPVEAVITEIPIVHGIIQAMKAAEDAPYYFLYLDNLVRCLKTRVFPNA